MILDGGDESSFNILLPREVRPRLGNRISDFDFGFRRKFSNLYQRIRPKRREKKAKSVRGQHFSTGRRTSRITRTSLLQRVHGSTRVGARV